MKASAFAMILLFIVSLQPQLVAQSGDSPAAGNNPALNRWVLTEKKLAAEGNVRAQEALGGFYYFGIGVPQDFTKAAYWLREAAAQEDLGAQFEIGDLYFKGKGVPQSYARAYFWLDLAAAQASPNTLLGKVPLAEMRDQAASHLTRSALLHVQEEAEKWLEAHKAQSHSQ